MLREVSGHAEQVSGKVNQICEAVKNELVRRDHDNAFLLPILTVYVKKQPQELKQVLSLIRSMQ